MRSFEDWFFALNVVAGTAVILSGATAIISGIWFAIWLVCLLLGPHLGDSARSGVLTGQVKAVERETPLLCADYIAIDVSLGTLSNGSGSVSTKDVWIKVGEVNADAARTAMSAGALVRVQYDTRRLNVCAPTDEALTVDVAGGAL